MNNTTKIPTTTDLFDAFIARNYDGLSAHTLFQTLSLSFPKEVAEQWVYVSVFHVFTNKYTPEELELSQFIAGVVFGDINFRKTAEHFRSELAELRYCINYGYKYHAQNLAYLKENALDMYLKNVIDIFEFKLIIEA